MSCWEIMYMIEIILLNQSKHSLLGVIRQIPLHAEFRVTLFDNFNDISIYFYNNSLCSMTYARCRVHIKQTLIYLNQEVRYGKNVEDVPL